mmetsp:Transcript_10455/g.28627  ORF Transcript_10455/g.28627 Transcript_10455/m.28627 type:complete len:260 (-) Transcript_10455:459-1238(-)
MLGRAVGPRSSRSFASKNETEACIKVTPRLVNWSQSHFSKLRYSRLEARAASSRQKGGGVASSTELSTRSSWHTSRSLETDVGSFCCSCAMHRSTMSPFKGQMCRRTTLELGFPCKYVPTNASTSDWSGPQPPSTVAAPITNSSGQTLSGCSRMLRTSFSYPLAANAASVVYRSRHSQHEFDVPDGDRSLVKPSKGSWRFSAWAQENTSGSARVACLRKDSCPSAFFHRPPTSEDSGNVSEIACLQILMSISSAPSSGT